MVAWAQKKSPVNCTCQQTAGLDRCSKCAALQKEYEELNAIIGDLQQQLANSKDTVITLDSYKAASAWERAIHAIIKLHPADQTVYKVVAKLRELQKQYLSGEK